jgi:virulence-associated protein VagC
MDHEFRQPTERERRLIDRLLSLPFEGREELVLQFETVKVKVIDENGSLALTPAGHPKAKTKYRVPTEGEALDQDGVSVHVVLHVMDGYAHELEIYKDSPERIILPVEPHELKLFSPDRVDKEG